MNRAASCTAPCIPTSDYLTQDRQEAEDLANALADLITMFHGVVHRLEPVAAEVDRVDMALYAVHARLRWRWRGTSADALYTRDRRRAEELAVKFADASARYVADVTKYLLPFGHELERMDVALRAANARLGRARNRLAAPIGGVEDSES